MCMYLGNLTHGTCLDNVKIMHGPMLLILWQSLAGHLPLPVLLLPNKANSADFSLTWTGQLVEMATCWECCDVSLQFFFSLTFLTALLSLLLYALGGLIIGIPGCIGGKCCLCCWNSPSGRLGATPFSGQHKICMPVSAANQEAFGWHLI